MAAKKAVRPVKGEAWVRKRDRFVIDVENVTRTKITIVERMMLLVYDYTPEQFARYFRPARAPIAMTDMIEPDVDPPARPV